MKTTLVIDDGVMRRLRQRAAREGTTISELVEAALRLLLESKRPAAQLPPLPSFRAGHARADIANRDALYDLMDER